MVFRLSISEQAHEYLHAQIAGDNLFQHDPWCLDTFKCPRICLPLLCDDTRGFTSLQLPQSGTMSL